MKKGIWIVGTDLTPESGGPYKTTQMFRRALNANILSMSSRPHLPNEAVKDDTYRIKTLRGLIPSLYTLSQANILTKDATLISSHTLFRFSQIYCYLSARKRKIPYWVVPHGSLDPWVFSYGRIRKAIWYHAFGRRYLKSAAHVIVATEREKSKMAELHSGANIRIISWPTEPIDGKGKRSAKRRVAERLGIPPDNKILLFLGRYHSMKRPMETIAAFKAAGATSTHLVLAGMDNDIKRDDLHEAASGCETIHALGPVFHEGKNELLLAADGYISLSYRENFNHTLAESMSAGGAPILSPGNDLGHMLPPSCLRWPLKGETVEEAVQAIRSFDGCSRSEIAAIGEECRNWTLKQLSFEKFQTSLQELAAEATQQPFDRLFD